MFSTLVESRAVRRRSVRGAVLSVIAHTFVIGLAVALTLPANVVASPDNRPLPKVTYVPAPMPHDVTPTAAHQPSAPQLPSTPVLNIPVPTTMPTSLPPIDIAGPSIPTDNIVLGSSGLPPTGTAPGSSSSFLPGAVLDENVVDRVPRLAGSAAAPRYPDALRMSGTTGQVIVRFVVDTLGHAEMGELTVIEATHPLFASAVKSALLGYRFTPGEAAGRKVRTMVQMPFSFTLR